MRKLLSWGAIAYTAKTAWWDKLPKEDQQKYINQAKGFFDKNKGSLVDAGKKFKEQHQGNHVAGSDGTTKEDSSQETPQTPMTPNHPRP